MAGMPPVRSLTPEESEAGWQSVYLQQQREAAASDARERARFASQGMPPAETPLETARKAGFPMTPIPGYYTPPEGSQPAPPVQNLPRSVLAPGALVPMKAGPTAAPELVPGAMDWVKNLVAGMMPSRSAQASVGATPPIGTPVNGMVPPTNNLARVSGAPNPNVMGPPAPQPSFFSRFVRGLVGPQEEVPLGKGGVRG